VRGTTFRSFACARHDQSFRIFAHDDKDVSGSARRESAAHAGRRGFSRNCSVSRQVQLAFLLKHSRICALIPAAKFPMLNPQPRCFAMRPRVSFVLASLAVFAASPALADIQITVDKTAQTLTVARDGAVLHTWPVSTGRVGRFTPDGNYQAFRMEEDHYSREFDDAPMPHSIFFTKRGHAIHGSFDVKKLGRPASGGCVRLAPENARTLFEMVRAEGVLKTKVTITGDERVALARADRNLTRGGSRQVERGTGLPPTYAPPVEDEEPRVRQRQAAPRDGYGPQYGSPPQQQQYYYDGYQWRAYQGQAYARPQQQPYYGGGYYAQPQYRYPPRYHYD
jgi:hypothetical protein